MMCCLTFTDAGVTTGLKVIPRGYYSQVGTQAHLRPVLMFLWTFLISQFFI